MNTYYLQYYPIGWFNVVKEGIADSADVINSYNEAKNRNNIFLKNKYGNLTDIYIYNNSFYFKGEADSIKEFIDMFFELLN